MSGTPAAAPLPPLPGLPDAAGAAAAPRAAVSSAGGASAGLEGAAAAAGAASATPATAGVSADTGTGIGGVESRMPVTGPQKTPSCGSSPVSCSSRKRASSRCQVAAATAAVPCTSFL